MVHSVLFSASWSGVTAPVRHRGQHGLATAAGVATVISVVGMWFVLLFVGWGLAFASSSGSVTDDFGGPVSSFERFVFAGYTIFTLGNGEFRPAGSIWQLATVAATLTGLTVVTLAVTYLILVVSAASERRQLAGAIARLGDSPDQILTNAWTGTDFDDLSQRLEALTERIDGLTESHLAFPIIHYFHSPERTHSAPAMIAALDDALTILLFGVAAIVPRGAKRVRAGIDDFLHTLHGPFLRPATPPPPLSLTGLMGVGIPLVSEAEFTKATDELTDRRALLAALAMDDGYPIYPGSHVEKR